MTVKERLLEYISYKGISIFMFEKSIGKTKSYIRNSASFSADVCSIICAHYPDLNVDWLIRGVGSMINEDAVPAEEEGVVDESITKRRLIEFIDYLGISTLNFEQSCGMAIGTISHCKYGISSANLRKICQTFPQLNLYWLVGVGGQKMLRASVDEQHEDIAEIKQKLSAIIDLLGRHPIG